MTILDRIDFVDFPRDQYYRTEHPKDQIVLHHTVSSVGVDGDLSWWLQTADRIATCLIIHHDGTPYQCFSSRFWAHHLGVRSRFLRDRGFDDASSRNVRLNQRTIGVEIDSAGGLTYRNGHWVSDFGRIIPTERVVEYPDGYRGYFGFEKYTDEQLRTVEELLRFWSTERYPHIPLTYREDMWDVSDDALSGTPGIFTHTSFRPDKSDCHPQPELVQMLQSLESTAEVPGAGLDAGLRNVDIDLL